MSETNAGQPQAIPLLKGLHLAGLVLVGQLVGSGCAGLLLTMLLVAASAVVPIPRSEAFALAVYAIIFIAGPVLGSWVIVRRAADHASSLFVSIISFLSAAGVVWWLGSRLDGSHQSVVVFALWALVLAPIASVLGSLLSSLCTGEHWVTSRITAAYSWRRALGGPFQVSEMRALRILHLTWASFLVLVCARQWFLGQLDIHPESKIVGVLILAQMVAALGAVRNVRLAWWACLVCSGLWFLVALLLFVTLPVLFISHPERPWATSWVPLGYFILVTSVPPGLSLWLYFRRRGEMFSSLLMPESRRAT